MQGSYNGCKTGIKQLQGVQGRYKAATSGTRQVQLQGRCESATMGAR